MTALAPTLEAFFTERLMAQRRASPNTVAAYRDSFRLLLKFAQDAVGLPPARLRIEDLDAPLIGSFLDHLEHGRGASVATRNARLAAVHSLFRFAAFRHPEHAAVIQRVLAIPSKRAERAIVAHLTRPEIDALLASPDRSTSIGRRDRALMLVAVQTGLRVSELTSLRRQDVTLGASAHVRCMGKGRKERATPLLVNTAAVLRDWMVERAGAPGDPLFPGPSGNHLSRGAVASVVARHACSAASVCPSIARKRVTPHVLRHSCAMELLHSGVDIATIALWLGHESIRTTDIYQHADLKLKEKALARTTPAASPSGRYRPDDALLAFLEDL
jgi:site-specific recombinase XerD